MVNGLPPSAVFGSRMTLGTRSSSQFERRSERGDENLFLQTKNKFYPHRSTASQTKSENWSKKRVGLFCVAYAFIVSI
jgi:hypothetical protein